MEETSGPRLFEREWIRILTTSDQHRIHSKLRFRKNMPFFGSIRYLLLRRKSATKNLGSNRMPDSYRLQAYNIHTHIFRFFENQGLTFDVARLILKLKAQVGEKTLAFKKSGAAKLLHSLYSCGTDKGVSPSAGRLRHPV